MSTVAAPRPIPGQPIDPPPKGPPKKLEQLDSKGGVVGTGVGIAFRTFLRFSQSQATLLAAGTTYYLFLAMFSMLALAYGLMASLGTDRMAAYLTEALNKAFPGLISGEGLSTENLQTAGKAASVIGLVGLIYGGIGGVGAAMRSLHAVYGAPNDSRKFFAAKARGLLWLVVIGPLIVVSLVASTMVISASSQILDALNLDFTGAHVVLTVVAIVVTLVLDFLVVYLVLGNFGGIRPPRRAHVIASGFGAVLIEILKAIMGLLIAYTIAKPQYGALAVPIGILFVLYLQSTALYACGALAGGIAEKDVPLEDLEVEVEAADA